ncbi:hypothetical protein [Rhodoblastus sp.]|uniref:hypothetical protein n=1 Tax=Rhodoblastus sp. TaxID=1962975 RepID=UPI003F9779EE
MTLCIVWRDGSNIKFASDSRLSLGSLTSDCGIKVVRIPFNIYGPEEPGGTKPLISSGDLGMAFAGNAVGALMVKEALAEVIFCMQVVPTFPDSDDKGMDSIADFVFRAYEVISKNLCATILEQGRTCIVFGGHCVIQNKLRAFRIETDDQNQRHKREILTGNTDVEIFGSGDDAAHKLMPSGATERDSIDVLQRVINDSSVPTVGGNIQYGSFAGSKFQPAGIAKLGDRDEFGHREVHYWRGPMDLNGSDFDQSGGLVPNFPMIDFIR